MATTYDTEERRQLLALAREAIASALRRDFPPDTLDGLERLLEKGACFVTLHRPDGSLRGCIGNMRAYEPLADNVVHNAINAALQDPRFPPVASEDELSTLEIEISVLTPPERIAAPGDFRVGEHGIILQRGGRSAVFLPQVAPEQGWDRETTLSQLALKAGLAPDAWKSPEAELSVFRAIVFSDMTEKSG
jgi:AmmeMemoRadiSam system protein A